MVQFTIITPLFNGAATIADCLASVTAQGGDIEHLVIDNNSTDAGPDIVRDARLRAGSSHVRLLSCPSPQGAGAARNKGLEQARGRFVAFLDADDRFLPGKLVRQHATMQERGLALSWTSYRALGRRGSRDQITPMQASRKALLHKGVVVGCSTVMIDRIRLGAHRFDESLPLAEDFALWLTMLRDCETRRLGFGGVPDILTEYRADGGVSADKRRAARAHWAALRSLGLSRHAAWRAMAAYIRHALRDRL